MLLRVSNPTMATNNVEDFRHSTHLLAATTLRYRIVKVTLCQAYVHNTYIYIHAVPCTLLRISEIYDITALLRNVLGTKGLAEILSEREQISHHMETSLDEATDPWGVKVERVEM